MIQPTTPHNRGRFDSSHSTSPDKGEGHLYASQRLEGVSIYLGKVDDSFPASGCCKVSLYGIHTSLPCFMAVSALGGMFGARQVAVPPMGTEVLVYVPMNRDVGYIIQCVPSIEDDPYSVPAHQLVTEGGVNAYSESEPFLHDDWASGSDLPSAGGGSAVDALPGDEGVINDLGVFVGVLRAMAAVRGSDLAKVEAFAFDDQLNVVGHKLNVYTAQGEKKVYDDHGRISEEEQLSLTQAESLGSADGAAFDANPDASLRNTPDQMALKDKIVDQVLKPRWRQLRGWLGGFRQSFISRPAPGPGSLSTADKPDMGLYQEALTLSGQHLQRSIVGGGFHKSFQIAVPKKKTEHDDPAGDKEIDESEIDRSDFEFDPEHPVGVSAQSRDYFAHIFNKQLPANRAALTKDWVTPDEADCPAPGNIPEVPGIGGFFREFPREEDAMAAAGGIEDDSALGSKKFRVGEAFMGIMPDGSIMMRNAWGDTVQLIAGHWICSVSKDATTIAGGSSITLAGDDIINKARKSIDVTASEGQVRFKGEKDILVHSEKGGILVSAPTAGAVVTDETGEKQSLSGIVLKSAPGVMAISDNIVLAAEQKIEMKGIGDKLPMIVVDCNSQIQRLKGSVIYKTGSEYLMMSSGSLLTTKGIQTDGSIVARESIVYGGSSGKSDDLKKNPTIKSTLVDVVTPELFIIPAYTEDQLSELKFTYRSTEEYATQEGMWYTSEWQRTLPDLKTWTESTIAETYPWPGEQHYDQGSQSLLDYQEVNVEKSGKPKKRDIQSSKHGTFTKQNFSEFKVHPDR